MNEIMKPRYRIYRRKRGLFYLFDRQTGKRESLQTTDEKSAPRLLHAKNEAQHQPLINRQIARAYLAAGDPEITQRTWQVVMDEVTKTKTGSTPARALRLTWQPATWRESGHDHRHTSTLLGLPASGCSHTGCAAQTILPSTAQVAEVRGWRQLKVSSDDN